VIEGDLNECSLGLSTVDWHNLAREIDAIYHCAADVDWVSSYAKLRSVNVGSTVELLKLASTSKRKKFHFISSLAVCYATTGPREVDEWEDMLPYLDGLFLGYAQTKCVAETLVRRAGERGLPVKIYRPSLISGETRTGVSNTDDIVSRVIKACIQMKCAPDLDWVLDCCPVDYVADALVKLSTIDNSDLQVFHIANQKPRHWRELILWMNLFGYSVSPIPYRSWIEKLEKDSRSLTHPLHQLRSFFLDSAGENQELSLPELYEEGRRSRVSLVETCQLLSDRAHDCPVVDAQLLEQYFASFIERGFLPPPPNYIVADNPDAERLPNSRMLEEMLRRHYQDSRIRILNLREQPRVAEHSIIAELTSWRSQRRTGVVKYIACIDDGRMASRLLEFGVKIKPKDTEVMEVGTRIAAMCSDKLGQAFERHVDRIGLTGSHLRGLGIYEQEDRRFSKYVPGVLGTIRNDEKHVWAIMLEWLDNVTLKDAVEQVSLWTPPYIEAAVRALGEIHAIWYEKEEELENANWLGRVMTSKDVTSMHELWAALALHSHQYFSEWLCTSTTVIQDKLVETVDEWWPALENMSRTLIHHDFNPRNIAFRETGQGPQLCVYDWELATLGIPQRDLAEFLSFVLSQRETKKDVLRYLEMHRTALQEASGRRIDPDMWIEGFRLALCDLLLNRFPMYTMIHTYRRQKYLERVICSWSRLYNWFYS
jgi:thioester reductase-like protein